MKFTLKAGVALAALSGAVAMANSAIAADRGGMPGGSVKDGGSVAPLPQVYRGASGPCYFRADVGYSFSDDPKLTFPVNNQTKTGYFVGDDPTAAFVQTAHTSTFVGDQVSNTSADGGVFGEVGLGCGWEGNTPGRGIRGEVALGFRGNHSIYGEPQNFNIDTVVVNDPTVVVPGPPPVDPNDPGPQVDDPLHTSIRSYTLMFNAYKDLGQFGRVTPYVGAGIGAAYHVVDETYFTGNYNLVNRIEGNTDLSFAWALMAGVGIQVSDRAILDVGYRYSDLGSAETGRVDSAGFVNPAVKIDDLTSHEIKVGLRYSFGGSDCCAQQYAPLK